MCLMHNVEISSYENSHNCKQFEKCFVYYKINDSLAITCFNENANTDI